MELKIVVIWGVCWEVKMTGLGGMGLKWTS